MDLKELYQEIILDHGKNPRNLRKTENFNKDAKGHNPLCGDKVHVYLKLDEEGTLNSNDESFRQAIEIEDPQRGLLNRRILIILTSSLVLSIPITED